MMIVAATNAMPWELPDEKLAAQCRFEAFVGSGPGGQKRHKTNAAVRYTHVPSGISAVATDSRSQRENKIHALRELRHKLALAMRREIDPLTYTPPAWFAQYPSLHMNPKNPLYAEAVAQVLDVLLAVQWEIPRAAAMLEISGGALMRFLHADAALWEQVNRVRGELGMRGLRFRD
jgi:RF-1 domain